MRKERGLVCQGAKVPIKLKTLSLSPSDRETQEDWAVRKILLLVSFLQQILSVPHPFLSDSGQVHQPQET